MQKLGLADPDSILPVLVPRLDMVSEGCPLRAFPGLLLQVPTQRIQASVPGHVRSLSDILNVLIQGSEDVCTKVQHFGHDVPPGAVQLRVLIAQPELGGSISQRG
jgi:hypothetical protein